MIQSLVTHENQSYYPTPTRHKTKIYANARFGIPSENCVGLGVCSIELLSSIHDTPAIVCDCDNGRVTIENLGGDRLRFQFLKSDLSPKSKAKHFDNNIFVIQEDFDLPSSVTRILGFKKTLKAGTYSVIEETLVYSIFL